MSALGIGWAPVDPRPSPLSTAPFLADLPGPSTLLPPSVGAINAELGVSDSPRQASLLEVRDDRLRGAECQVSPRSRDGRTLREVGRHPHDEEGPLEVRLWSERELGEVLPTESVRWPELGCEDAYANSRAREKEGNGASREERAFSNVSSCSAVGAVSLPSSSSSATGLSLGTHGEAALL